MNHANLNIENPGSDSRLRWNRGYPLNFLGRGAAADTLPAPRTFLGDREILEECRLLVFGERSGGARDFLKWWRQRLDYNSRPWLYAQGKQWKGRLFSVSKATNLKTTDGTQPHTIAREKIELLASNDSIEGASSLLELDSALEGPYHLIIRDLGSLNEDAARTAAIALRIAGERLGENSNLRILIASTSEGRFQDDYHTSGLASLCSRYRLPRFLREEIVYLAEFSIPAEPLRLSPDALDFFLRTTGGQPLLSHHLLHLLRSRNTDEPVELSSIYRAKRTLVRSYLPVIESWKRELRGRVESQPELRDALAAYAKGHSLSERLLPPPPIDFGLMVSGWVGFDTDMRRWGISSTFHAEIARQVLDSVRNY